MRSRAPAVLGRFDKPRGEPCGDVEAGRVRARSYSARARRSRSDTGPNPGPHHRGGCDLTLVAAVCDRRQLDHLGGLRGRASRRAHLCPSERAALRAHWLDVAIVVLTIPLLGKALAFLRLARLLRLARFVVIVARALQAERRLTSGDSLRVASILTVTILLPLPLTTLFLPFIYLLRSYIRWEDRRFQQRWRRDFASG